MSKERALIQNLQFTSMQGKPLNAVLIIKDGQAILAVKEDPLFTKRVYHLSVKKKREKDPDIKWDRCFYHSEKKLYIEEYKNKTVEEIYTILQKEFAKEGLKI